MAGLAVVESDKSKEESRLGPLLFTFLFPLPLSLVASATQALHGAASGTVSVNQILFAWVMMIVFSIAYVLLSEGLYRKILYRARVEASLDTEG